MPPSTSAPTTNKKLIDWVAEIAGLVQPERIEWCDGSAEEYDRLCQLLVDQGTFTKLAEAKRPNSYWAGSDPADVARVEDRTFICSALESDAGPTNNWRDPDEMREVLRKLFDGAMRGRTMYVVPFSMGPLGSDKSHIGVQLTDSPYVVVSMRIMTRMGKGALEVLGAKGEFVPCHHSVGAPLQSGQADVPWPCDAENKYIVHFPETREIVSYGSGYGGNALLGKKCLALRIASVLARDEGWLAEHMLIVKLTSPTGEVRYITGAFPSACGKTNLAMLVPTLPGWKVETIGDDICWMKFDDEGRLRAINPEAGFFGVAPGTNRHTNPNRHADAAPPTRSSPTRPRPTTPTSGGKAWTTRPSTARTGEARTGPPRRGRPPPTRTRASRPPPPRIRRLRRSGRTPKVCRFLPSCLADAEPRSSRWSSSPSTGNTECSSVRSSRRRPPRRRPVPWASCDATPSPCCRSAGTTWPTTSPIGCASGPRPTPEKLPKIFYVNWFRKAPDGRWLWPGYGENSRVLEWVFDRAGGRGDAIETPVGWVPAPGAIDIEGVDVSKEDMEELLRVDNAEWRREVPLIREHYAQFGDRLPASLATTLDAPGGPARLSRRRPPQAP